MRLLFKNGFLILTSTLFFMSSCTDNTSSDTADTHDTTSEATFVPAVIPYQLVNTYPHDNTCYTEGLQYVNGFIYESGGQYGKSDIRKANLETGKILQQTKMDARYFGEGITILNGKIYQLTYRERTGFVYDLATMKQLQTFSYKADEGWGMTNDSTHIIFSDGTDKLHFIDPATFNEVKVISVSDQYGKVSNINELEYIKGFIYANQYQTDLILKIDPATGKVVAQADLSNIRSRTGIPENTNTEGQPEVLNGIAYDAKANRIFITGKNWPYLFEIKLDN